MDLGEAGLSGNDSADSRLDGGLFVLKIFDLFYNDVTVLLWGEPVDTVEENCAVVVGDQVRFPR